MRRAPKEPPARRHRRWPLLVLGLFVAIAGGGGYLLYRAYYAVPDYEGSGRGDVIVQVKDGDLISSIATELARQDVVRSAKAFTTATAENDRKARSLQPGYYKMRLRMSGTEALNLILDPDSRVGQLEIKGGVQLDDTRTPEGVVTPGVLSLVSKASCAELNGVSTCVSVDALRDAMVNTPPAQLGVPAWALADVTRADPKRRLEGLVAPGRYNVRPGSSAVEVLRKLVTSSAATFEAAGLVTQAPAMHFTPYQLLVISSLVEKEGITADFGKISRVVYNRLQQRIRLGLDSTVNYPLDLQEIRTSEQDRDRPGPYNTYLNFGLPPTPIAAPGQHAMQATLAPENGPWVYFVRCQKDGNSCFATTFGEHQQNVKAAIAAGAF